MKRHLVILLKSKICLCMLHSAWFLMMKLSKSNLNKSDKVLGSNQNLLLRRTYNKYGNKHQRANILSRNVSISYPQDWKTFWMQSMAMKNQKMFLLHLNWCRWYGSITGWILKQIQWEYHINSLLNSKDLSNPLKNISNQWSFMSKMIIKARTSHKILL